MYLSRPLSPPPSDPHAGPPQGYRRSERTRAERKRDGEKRGDITDKHIIKSLIRRSRKAIKEIKARKAGLGIKNEGTKNQESKRTAELGFPKLEDFTFRKRIGRRTFIDKKTKERKTKNEHLKQSLIHYVQGVGECQRIEWEASVTPSRHYITGKTTAYEQTRLYRNYINGGHDYRMTFEEFKNSRYAQVSSHKQQAKCLDAKMDIDSSCLRHVFISIQNHAYGIVICDDSSTSNWSGSCCAHEDVKLKALRHLAKIVAALPPKIIALYSDDITRGDDKKYGAQSLRGMLKVRFFRVDPTDSWQATNAQLAKQLALSGSQNSKVPKGALEPSIKCSPISSLHERSTFEAPASLAVGTEAVNVVRRRHKAKTKRRHRPSASSKKRRPIEKVCEAHLSVHQTEDAKDSARCKRAEDYGIAHCTTKSCKSSCVTQPLFLNRIRREGVTGPQSGIPSADSPYASNTHRYRKLSGINSEQALRRATTHMRVSGSLKSPTPRVP